MYKPTVAHQLSKLGSVDGDWNLAGGATTATRTRNAGRITPHLQRTNEVESSDTEQEEEADDEEEEWDESLEDDTEEEEEPPVVGKPKSSRVILEVKTVSDLLSKHCRCVRCDGPMTTTFKTVCLATKVTMRCNDTKCR
jgi:hypothetical protein